MLAFWTSIYPGPAEAEEPLRKAIEIAPSDPFYRAMLGNTLENTGQYAKAEAVLKGAIEVAPDYPYAWAALGALLARNTCRDLEAEQALRRAIQLQPANPFALSCLAEVLTRDPARVSEARSDILKAIELDPSREWYQTLFTMMCGNCPGDWQLALPGLAAWCAANPKNAKVFDFTVDGFLQYARLTKPADALALLQALPDTSPFETLMDAFRAHADREHLNRLAPERQAVVIELLNRLCTPKQQ